MADINERVEQQDETEQEKKPKYRFRQRTFFRVVHRNIPEEPDRLEYMGVMAPYYPDEFHEEEKEC